MFNAFQWNCFNLVDTCNTALILFLKCDVTKFRIPPPLVTQCHTSSTPSPPLMCDVMYGWPHVVQYPLILAYNPLQSTGFTHTSLSLQHVLYGLKYHCMTNLLPRDQWLPCLNSLTYWYCTLPHCWDISALAVIFLLSLEALHWSCWWHKSCHRWIYVYTISLEM